MSTPTYRAGSGDYQQVLSATVTPSAVPSGNWSSETFKPSAFAAITNDSWCRAQFPSLEAGLFLVNSFISATGTITVQFYNATGSTITPAAQTCQLLVF